jgi:hypothetical protein
LFVLMVVNMIVSLAVFLAMLVIVLVIVLMRRLRLDGLALFCGPRHLKGLRRMKHSCRLMRCLYSWMVLRLWRAVRV